jgi:hypothetical protein
MLPYASVNVTSAYSVVPGTEVVMVVGVNAGDVDMMIPNLVATLGVVVTDADGPDMTTCVARMFVGWETVALKMATSVAVVATLNVALAIPELLVVSATHERPPDVKVPL